MSTEAAAANADRRAIRFALGTGIATLVTYGLGLDLPFLSLALAVGLLAPAVPAPGLKAVIVLVATVLVTSVWGLLVGQLVTMAPVPGILLMLLAIGVAAALGTNPATAVLATFVIVGTNVVAALATLSSAAGAGLAREVAFALVFAVANLHLVQALLPDKVPAPPAAPPPRPENPGLIALRAAVIMLPPILVALSDPALYMPLLVKGALLTRQHESGRARSLAFDTAASTGAAGLATLVIWQLLKLWPSLPFFALLLAIAMLLVGRRLYGVRQSPGSFDFWMNLGLTIIILIGPAVGDSATGDDIETKMLIRFGLLLAIGLYAAVTVHLFDSWAARRAARRA